jgi:hypothetical protein
MASDPGAGKSPTTSARDMARPSQWQSQASERLDAFAGKFAEMHEKNKKALMDRKFVLFHDITIQIQDLMSRTKDRLSRESVSYPETASVGEGFAERERISDSRVSWDGSTLMGRGGLLARVRKPAPSTEAGEYPGPLPESLKQQPNEAILILKQEEEECRRRMEQELRMMEEARRKAAEEAKILAARRARRENRIQIGKALREAALAKGVLKEGDRCPKCGFSYAWDGTGCYHCDHREDQQP